MEDTITIPFEEKAKYLNGEGNIIGYEYCDILTQEDPDCEEIDCCIDCFRFDTCLSAKINEEST